MALCGGFGEEDVGCGSCGCNDCGMRLWPGCGYGGTYTAELRCCALRIAGNEPSGDMGIPNMWRIAPN